MSLLRTSRSILPKCPISKSRSIIFTRNFHSPLPLSAQYTRSPRVRAASRSKQTNINTSRTQRAPTVSTYNVEESLPPLPLLESARQEGVLDIEVEKALEFLRAFALSHSTKSTGTWEERLSADYQVTPQDLCQLSYSMIPSEGVTSPPVSALAKVLMQASASLGCKEATCAIIHSGLMSGMEVNLLNDTGKHLKQLAAADDKQAMTLLGMVLASQKRDQEALSWFCAAVGWTIPDPRTSKGMQIYKSPPQPTQDIEFDGANEALLNIGRLLIKMHTDPIYIAQAQEAFSLAALELDDPISYYYLAKLKADQTEREESNLTPEEATKQYDVANSYLEKAAASGVRDAWTTLSEFSSARLQRQQEGSKSPRTWRLDMAKEWTLIGKEFAKLEANQERN